MCVYIYICNIYICIYIHIYIYIYIHIHIGLYKILFYVEAFVHESVLLLLPPLTCIARIIAILLHIYCAIYDAPLTPRLYAIHNTILVMAISGKGQISPTPCITVAGLRSSGSSAFPSCSLLYCSGHSYARLE